MTTATLSYSRIQRKIQTQIDSVETAGINWKIICFSGFFTALILLVFYVWQIQDLTRGSYLLNSYEKQISKLSDDNKNLQVSFAESGFLNQMLSESQALNFQKVAFGSVKYIQIPDNSVAIAK
jgi:hypothetical protein